MAALVEFALDFEFDRQRCVRCLYEDHECGACRRATPAGDYRRFIREIRSLIQSAPTPAVSELRQIAAPSVADPATGVCIRTRLKGLTDTDEGGLSSTATSAVGLSRPPTQLSQRAGHVWSLGARHGQVARSGRPRRQAVLRGLRLSAR